jgi:anthranilate synthase component 2
MARILIIDNYDSFTFNLSHLLEAVSGRPVDVFRSDAISSEALRACSHIVFSPGPGLPDESKALMELVKESLGLGVPALGVCLGHQALAIATGGTLKNLDTVHHGVAIETSVTDMECPLFRKIDQHFLSGRYHSWVVHSEALPACWKVTALDPQREIMAMRHENGKVFGIQFHPESVLTPNGRMLLENFVRV